MTVFVDRARVRVIHFDGRVKAIVVSGSWAGYKPAPTGGGMTRLASAPFDSAQGPRFYIRARALRFVGRARITALPWSSDTMKGLVKRPFKRFIVCWARRAVFALFECPPYQYQQSQSSQSS